MPNYRKKNNQNNRNKNKNKNKTTSSSSSSVKQEIQVVESKTTVTHTTPGIEPNLPADVRNSYTASAEKSVFEEKNVVVVVNVDEASTISPLSNEEIDGNACNFDIDTFSGISDEDTIQKQSNYSSTFYSSSSSKKSTEIEDRQLNRAVFNIGDSTLGDSVIRETFVKQASSAKNSFKTGSANTKDAAVSAAEKPAATATQSIESTKINESVSEKVRDISEQRSKSTESATEVIESNNQSSHFLSKEDYSSKVIVQTGVAKNGSDQSMTHSPSEESSRVIVHQVTTGDPSAIHQPKSQVIIHREEQSSSASSSHRASKNGGVDLSKKTSTKAAESSTTQTLSFSNVRGQPSRQIIYEPRKVILGNFSSDHGPSRAIIHQISKDAGSENVNANNSKVIVHQISKEENQRTSTSNDLVITPHALPQTTDYKLILHQISPSSSDRSNGKQQSSPRSADSFDELSKVIDNSIFQQSFAENTSKRINIDQQDRFTQNVSKKDFQEGHIIPKLNQETQLDPPSDKSKRVILIPILQENSTQTSPLPSFSENPLHSNLLEIIKDENIETKGSNKSEISRQTSSSPLSRSPVICFENLSKSFELNKTQPEDPSKGIDSPEGSIPESSPKSSTENSSPNIIEYPILQEVSTQSDTTPTVLQSSQTSPQRAENLQPLKIPVFPFTRATKVIIHPIINEASVKPAFPFSEKSLKTINTSSKEIANQILKEVSSELKSSFISESNKKEVDNVYSEPIRTSFPVSLKNHASFRPGFFETNIFEKEINPLDSESKVIVHQISTKGLESTESKSDNLPSSKPLKSNTNKVEEKVIVHQISQEESNTSHRSESKITNDSSKSTSTSHLNEDKSHSSSAPTSSSFPISVEKETHAAQYTYKPEDSPPRTIDLQSLRDNAEFRQSSSTMTSTYGLTETANKKEITHKILKEGSDLQKEAIDHQIQPGKSNISQSESKESSNSSGSKPDLNRDKPKVILHQISKENTSISRSPSFPLVNEVNEAAASIQKNSENPKEVFPLCSLKNHHPQQNNSKSTVLEQKNITFERLRDEFKLIQASASPFAQTLMQESKDHKVSQSLQSSDSSSTPFPISAEKQKQSSFTSQPVFKDKCESPGFPITSSFPISVEKEIHAAQYTSRPEDTQLKTIDLQSLRDTAEFRQSSSTMTSTYGLTETENKKEIIHQISIETPSSDLQQQSFDQSSLPNLPGLSKDSKIPSSPNSRSQDHVQKSIDQQTNREPSEILQSSSTKKSTICPTEIGRTNKDQPKEIIHPISRERSASDLQPQSPDRKIPATKESNQPSLLPKEIIHQIVKEDSSSVVHPQTLDHQTSQDESISSSEGSVLTVIQNESPRSISPPTAEEPKTKVSSDEKAPKRSFFLAPIQLPHKTQSEAVEVKQELQMISPEFVKVFNHPIVRHIEKPLGYRVESPQPDKIPMIVKKSKSFDDDDVVIQEMSDTSSAGDTDNPPLISEAESETDTIEAVDDLPDTPTSSSLLSIQTLPMDHETDSMSPKSSQEYKSRRQQNRAALESHFLPQFLAPNFLDSIKEENSDLSDSDRRSSCSDRVDAPVHHGDLDDDVFLDPPKKANAVYPKSNLDFSKKHKHVLNVRPPKTSVIREESSPPSVVEAKIIDQGSIEESCSSWSTDLTPESEAAEVVYIDSASSSVSDLLELDYSQGQPDDSTDVRIQTPTIDLESVNEMFATCQQIESNDRKIFIPPSEKPPPPPPVNDDATTITNATIQENTNEHNLLPSHNKNDLPDTTKLKLENEKCKILDEIISQKIETMSETAGDTHTISDDLSASATLVSAENSIANNLNSCDSAIDQIVTSNTSPSVTAAATATAVVVVGSIKNMENIREIVNTSSASSKSELDIKITDRSIDHGFSKPNFMIGQPCSDHTLKCDTKSSSSSSSTSSSTTTNTITTTTTKILTLHDLSQTLENTKHLINPLVSPSSSVLDRQESLDSHGSDQSHSTNQSQCTAINQGSLPHCDWNEFDTTTDTTYVSESDTAAGLASSEASSPLTTRGAETSGDETESPPIRKLRSLCTEALASMPYGEEVLQELATVAENIRDMPYPLPDLPQIQDIQLSLGAIPSEKTSVITLSQVPPRLGAAQVVQKLKSPPPPPVPAPPTKYDAWLGVPSESDPNVLVCLSPSQRNAVKSDSTADSLLDMHKKFVERRGYHEYTTKQVNAINQANTSEAPKLSKFDSPPPPPLPPRPPTQLPNPNGNTDINDENDDEEDQNNHRLLAIIRDTHHSQQQQHQQKSSMTSTSENISRRTESGIHNTVNTSTSKDGGSSCLEKEFTNTPCSVNKQSQERKFISESNTSHAGEMQQSESEHPTNMGGESVMGVKFPTSEYFDSIFAGQNKRFSNIETGSRPEFCSQILSTQPKRYSNIETSTFEAKKCVENGKVLYDVCDSKREKISEGDQPDSPSVAERSGFFPELSKTKTNGLEGSFPFTATANRSATDNSRPQTGGDSENIMSAFKLNTTQTTAPPAAASTNRVESSPPAPPVPPLPSTLTADTTATSSMISTKSTSKSESHINRTFNAKTSEKTFDDFGQHAKEAAATTTNSKNESSSTTKKPSDAFQHEKLFKEFDELSNLLKDELESGKRRPPATLNGNDIPSSVIDYNRVARESKIQNSHVSSTTSTETNRKEQMKKLADEIDRTSKHKLQQRREMRIPIIIEKSAEGGPRSAPVLPQEPRSDDIPVRVESGHSTRPSLQHQRSYEIPIRVEQPSNSGRQRTYSEHQPQPRTHEIPIQVEKPQPDRFRRAESMFNISDSTPSRNHLHHDDWMKYVGDLGSSENICKPFQREVEICYLGRRPNIRAPRMSASTSDLSSIQTFDTHGAYDVRRTAQTPRPQQPPPRAYLSTQSLIDTTPITPCVSARRSPAPERRSSLPRELHDKQLQYITSKEQQLKYEFERLENERRHLIDEMNRVQMNQRISREAYRQRQLPPLTEDESFRQQMAEEWLHKVAEREERRLQKIIKISKVHQEAGVPVAPPRRHSAADDIGDEFLRRVKERRSKLCMPSDSDWESGAESHPLPRTDGSRSENDEPPVTVFEGQSTTNIKELPKHLREFAKLTSQMKEEHRQEMTENTSTSASKMTSLKTSVKMTGNNHHSIQESQSMQQDGRYPYKANGYMSEPERNYDSDYSTVKYRTLERRRLQSTGGTESRTSAAPTGNESQDETFYGTMPNPVKSGQGSYKVQPGRIENYITGHSSVSEKEKKEQLDQQKLSPHYTEGNLSRALLKEQGYTSDSNLVFRKKDVPILQSPLSPVEQKQVYKNVQAGGQPPLLGFRKPAPEKPKDDDDVPTPPVPPTKGVPLPLDSNGSYILESPNRYFESDVNIHYKTPIRYEYKDPIPEEELAIRQAETMQKLYQEERRRKYLQELQDMNSRRHTDNFTPSQKSPIPLNRYDDFNSDLAPKSPNSTNYPRTVARALYNFQGQTARELTFKKGDVIYIRRQIDKNWFEGEHNAMIGLLPSNYVELLTKDGIRQPPKKPSEGQARAKYNFQAQSGIELSLNKGEHVILTRRVDENWYEGKIANRKGIFPVSYVEVLVDIGAEDKAGRQPATQSIITQSSSSMLRPSLDTLRTNINNEFNSLTSNGQPPNGILRETRTLHKTEVLHVDTNTEPVAYRALYKYRPQNTDELELQEGDIVFVLEKCDDGWFVGTSQRSGCFGTFPGNYVERV